MFLTNKEYSEKSEVLRMLWGANQEFVGCPKLAEVSKALSIDAEVPFRTHFPLLGSFIDSSFYDIE
jgi:hypothetical protein